MDVPHRDPSAQGVRFLFIGDLHLGRRPVRLPEELEPEGSRLGPAGAWERAIDAALEHSVDAVVLAGDVVESVEDRFEAVAVLERGVRRLLDEGVGVFAVVGNHDIEALPRLARLVEGVRLIGRGGEWESVVVEGQGGASVHVLGWSFSRRRESSNPLAGLDGSQLPCDGRPVIGVLHADLGASGGSYAPIPRDAIDQGVAGRVAAWFLGHIHKPDDLSAARPVGYLGSLVGLDSGEPGLHGPWVVDVGEAVEARQLVTSPLRYERCALDVSGTDGCDDRDLQDEMLRRIRSCAAEEIARLGQAATDLRALALRICLRGRVAAPALVEQAAAACCQVDGRPVIVHQQGALSVYVERVVSELRSEVDLDQLASAPNPAGLLAKHLLALEGAENGLVSAFVRRCAQQGWGLDGVSQDEQVEAARHALLRVGHGVLDRMLGRREELRDRQQ